MKTFNKLKLLLLATIFFAFSSCGAAFTQNATNSFKLARYLKKPATIKPLGNDILYPEYFREQDKFSYEKILEGFKVRWEFIKGIRPEDRFQDCHRKLRKIEEAIKLLKDEKEISIRWIDNNFVLNPKSPIRKVQKFRKRRTYRECKYSSNGDLASGGVVFCCYHGIAFDSPSYQKYKDQIEKHRPLITPDDVVDLILFSPIVLIIPLIYYILIYILNKPPQKRQQK